MRGCWVLGRSEFLEGCVLEWGEFGVGWMGLGMV